MLSLATLFFAPLIASAAVLALPKLSARVLKGLAFLLSLIPLALLAWGGQRWVGVSLRLPWLPALSIDFSLSLDSLSLIFVWMTAIVVPVSVFSARMEVLHSRMFYALVLLLESLLIGFFSSRDLALFLIFWEAMLLPLFAIMALWGGAHRQSAALKFLIYMLAGSALMVAAVLSLYFSAKSITGQGTFDLSLLARTSAGMPEARWVFAIFLLAFAVKTPLFPFHSWLPDAYCQAPTPGTILLAGLLSKAGIYGLLRIGVELFPSLMREWGPWCLDLAIAGVLYGALAAWRQQDFKRLLAYASFSHVNFILAGLFVWSEATHAGAVLQAFNHGVTMTALFLVAGWLEERLSSTEMSGTGGLAKVFPQLCWFTLLFVLSSVALPGLNTFVGEVLILFGVFGFSPWAAVFLGATVILSVVYLLRFQQEVFFGTPTRTQTSWVDIRAKEKVMAWALAAIIVGVGVYPAPLLRQIQPAASRVAIVEEAP